MIIPLYFDTPSLKELLIQFKGLAPQMRLYKMHFIIVDDSAGKDSSIDTLRSHPQISILTPPQNLGHQQAIVYGIRYLSHEVADSDLVVTMDGDGEDQPHDVLRLLAALQSMESSTHNIALAWRTKRRESLKFKVLYFFFKIFFWTLSGHIMRSGNFAAYRGSVAKITALHPNFDLCYSSSLHSVGGNLCKILCEKGPRYAGHSKMNTKSLIKHGFVMLLPFATKVTQRLAVFITLSLLTQLLILWGLATDKPWNMLQDSTHLSLLLGLALVAFVSGFGLLSMQVFVSHMRAEAAKRKLNDSNLSFNNETRTPRAQ